MVEKIIIEMEVTDCFRCPFLSSSNTGENCRLLRKGIKETDYSNIGFSFEEGWRYDKCPLLHKGYICRDCGIEVMELKE